MNVALVTLLFQTTTLSPSSVSTFVQMATFQTLLTHVIVSSLYLKLVVKLVPHVYFPKTFAFPASMDWRYSCLPADNQTVLLANSVIFFSALVI